MSQKRNFKKKKNRKKPTYKRKWYLNKLKINKQQSANITSANQHKIWQNNATKMIQVKGFSLKKLHVNAAFEIIKEIEKLKKFQKLARNALIKRVKIFINIYTIDK